MLEEEESPRGWTAWFLAASLLSSCPQHWCGERLLVSWTGLLWDGGGPKLWSPPKCPPVHGWP